VKPGEICLGWYPFNAGKIDIDPDVLQYGIGDKFTFTAVPNTGRKFFKWGGTIDMYEASFEYVVTTEDQEFIAYFPEEVFNDSTVFLGEYPDNKVSIGEYAYFNFALDLPLDSTYILTCTCNKYDNFTFIMNCTGNAMGLNVGCKNDTAIIQDEWTVKVKFYDSGAEVAEFKIYYRVEWIDTACAGINYIHMSNVTAPIKISKTRVKRTAEQ
jgi:hypothetical protein